MDEELWADLDMEEMDEETLDVQATVTAMIREALDDFEENREPSQVEATEYYHGELFGNEKKNRSKVVSTDVKDAVKDMMPSLLRIFFSTDRVVEFSAVGIEDEALAQQMTDYINHVVVQQDNKGLLTTIGLLKDGLVRRIGVVKWWREKLSRVSETELEELTEQQLMSILEDEDVEDMDVLGVSEDPQMGPLYSVKVRRLAKGGYSAFAAVPPEEVIFTPGARSFKTAPLVAHIREVRVDELLSMGIPLEDFEDDIGNTERVESDTLEAARDVNGEEHLVDGEDEDALDPSQRKVLFCEAYALVDADEDGIGERRLFWCVGPSHKIVNGDGLGVPVSRVPMAYWTPDPEPHTVEGESIYDDLKEIQLVKSQVLRGMLDSLSQAVNMDTEVVQGQVNLQDVLSSDVSKVIRVRAPGMLRDIQHPFVGDAALPVLGYFDQVKEDRTGAGRASKGLDADALQSSTKAAVTAVFTKSQDRIEYIARVFAEMCWSELFEGLLELEIEHQNRKRKVRILNQYVEVDPRSWNSGMDVRINVGLGQGTPEDKLAHLAEILAKQEQLLQLGSPIVSMVEYRRSLARMVELRGTWFADEFFKPWGPQEEQQFQQMKAQQPPPPDPTMALVEVEKAKAEVQAQTAMMKLQLEQMKITLQDDRERDKMAREMALREREIELKHQVEIRDGELKAQVARDRAAMDADIKGRQLNAGGAQ